MSGARTAVTNAEILAALSALLDRPVESLSQLYSGPVNYQVAFPLLVGFLECDTERWDKDGIARCLAVKAAKGIAGPALVRELRHDPDAHGGVLWALANAVEVVVTPELLGDILDLVFDERYGHARRMLTLALGRLKDPRAVDALVQLLEDPVVDGHAVSALGKLARMPEARSGRDALLPFAAHPVTWKRNAAKSALARFDKEAAKAAP